jgi:hypothetical protein
MHQECGPVPWERTPGGVPSEQAHRPIYMHHVHLSTAFVRENCAKCMAFMQRMILPV